MIPAYRPNHSTETALMRVQHDITKELDQDRGVALVLLDLSVAFDTITTRGVIDTLHQQIGVTGVPLTWFKSYLSTSFVHFLHHTNIFYLQETRSV